MCIKRAFEKEFLIVISQAGFKKLAKFSMTGVVDRFDSKTINDTLK